jgi:RNA polymerase primary sigma factor
MQDGLFTTTGSPQLTSDDGTLADSLSAHHPSHVLEEPIQHEFSFDRAMVRAAGERNHDASDDERQRGSSQEIGAAFLHSELDPSTLATALKSLEATKIRTGVQATRADLHRIIKRFALSPIDAAELDIVAQEADLVEAEQFDELEEGGSFDADSIRMLLEDTRRYRLLRPEEHKQLARAIALGREADQTLCLDGATSQVREKLKQLSEEGRRAYRRFVASNIRLVVSIAKTYLNQGLDFADLIQEGCCGLMRAVELYDPEQAQFSTYAYYWIMQSITRAIADKGRLIRLPVHVHEDLNRMRRAIKELEHRFGRPPTHSEVAEHLNFSRDKVAALSQWLNTIVSLDAPATDDGDALGYFVPSRDEPVEDKVANIDRNITLFRAMRNILTARQVEILRLRFGLGGGRQMTLEDVGRNYGLTRERIRQIESKALKKLRSRLQKSRLLEKADAY